ncbi:hypothetical protein [Streptomyces sp. NBC_00878]|uniref:hypothetical protein n=1 Tax=Streptomyces sp. NBC_00878 TaxID=2975854 RepID=UPI0022554893|nr:hypothetical protein [Streptomyces sp. NBC_00878]MCX4908951.1 hypothetical protein [Streptomyces sp. NBC_00878]
MSAQNVPTNKPDRVPEPGTLMMDTSRDDRVGEFRGDAGPYWSLRPMGGGTEWEAKPAEVRPADQGEPVGEHETARALPVSGSERTTPPAVHMPALEPVPLDGCRICTALAGQRDTARRLGSMVTVQGVNDQISNHPHRRATGWKGDDT